MMIYLPIGLWPCFHTVCKRVLARLETVLSLLHYLMKYNANTVSHTALSPSMPVNYIMYNDYHQNGINHTLLVDQSTILSLSIILEILDQIVYNKQW